jgi:hypothetical protein
MPLSVTYLHLLDVPFVQQSLLRAYDLLQACENADEALITDEIREAAVEFRRYVETERP